MKNLKIACTKPKKFFKLYANCIAVEGRECSLIIDFHQKKYLKIPIQNVNLLVKEFDNFEIYDNEDFLEKNKDNLIFKIINLLHSDKMGFFTDSPKEFPETDHHISESPEWINNAVIEIDNANLSIYKKVFAELEQMLCRYIELWFTEELDYNFLEETVRNWENSVLRSFSIIINAKNINSEKLINISEFFSTNLKIDNLVFYNCDNSVIYNKYNVTCIKEDISNVNYEKNKYDRIIMDMNFFIEVKNRNPFYYKKVSIDKYGNIKNFLSNTKIYGNIKNDSLIDICSLSDFKSVWYATNDKIDQIKDSPMRYCYSITDELIPLNNGNFKIKTDLQTFPWDNIK